MFVDADVWQTLAAEGALRALKQAPVVRVKAGADPSAWIARSKLVPSAREKRLYEFGAALLKILETSVGTLPDGQKLFLSFEGGQMVLTAPASFMDQMRTGGNETSSIHERTPSHGRPKWVDRPRFDTLGSGSKLDWTAWAIDDSGGPTYNYRYKLEGKLPPGLTWNADRHRLQGTLGSSGSWNLVFRVQDAFGASDTLHWNLVSKNGAKPISTAQPVADLVETDLNLPDDSLTARHWTRWNMENQASHWQQVGAVLDSVDGDEAEVAWSNNVLAVRPMHEGIAKLQFHFKSRSEPIVLVKECPVKPLSPPRFLSLSGGAMVGEGATRLYRPVARDADGGPVSLQVDFSPKAPFSWDGTDLRVYSTSPGSWSAKFTARDTFDQIAEQWVTFTTSSSPTSRWRIETRQAAGTNPWMVSKDFGRGRLSLFSPAPSRLVNWKHPTRQDWPYLMMGANLLSAESSQRGDLFAIDLGGTLRMPDPAVLTGGIAGRIQARFDARPALPWVFEGEFLGWVQQAIVATDTGRIRTSLESRSDVNDLDSLVKRYGNVMKQVLNDAFDPHNAVFLTKLEGWWQLPYHLGVGMGASREDLPVIGSLCQRLTTGLRWSPTGRWGSLETTLRGGWGPGAAKTAVGWELRWSSGILP